MTGSRAAGSSWCCWSMSVSLSLRVRFECRAQSTDGEGSELSMIDEGRSKRIAPRRQRDRLSAGSAPSRRLTTLLDRRQRQVAKRFGGDGQRVRIDDMERRDRLPLGRSVLLDGEIHRALPFLITEREDAHGRAVQRGMNRHLKRRYVGYCGNDDFSSIERLSKRNTSLTFIRHHLFSADR